MMDIYEEMFLEWYSIFDCITFTIFIINVYEKMFGKS